MFGRKLKAVKEAPHEPERREHDRREHDRRQPEDAESLVKATLDTLDQSLAAKREAREKTVRFVGSLRPLAAKR
jgi:hypothetical protein